MTEPNIATMADELQRKEMTQPMLEVWLRPPTATLQLAGLLQLALRHPGVSFDQRETAARFLAGIREYFADCPTVLEVLDAGDHR
jgi:hypothetical protein